MEQITGGALSWHGHDDMVFSMIETSPYVFWGWRKLTFLRLNSGKMHELRCYKWVIEHNEIKFSHRGAGSRWLLISPAYLTANDWCHTLFNVPSFIGAVSPCCTNPPTTPPPQFKRHAAFSWALFCLAQKLRTASVITTHTVLWACCLCPLCLTEFHWEL